MAILTKCICEIDCNGNFVIIAFDVNYIVGTTPHVREGFIQALHFFELLSLWIASKFLVGAAWIQDCQSDLEVLAK